MTVDFCMVEFHDNRKGTSCDLQLPMNLTGNELVRALTSAYQLPIDLNNPDEMYLRAEDPIMLISGEETIEDLGMSNGTRIFFDPR